MCFHAEGDYEKWAKNRSEQARAIYGQIIMRHTSPAERLGKFAEGFPVDVRDQQEVANVIKELRTWHPGKRVVDLSHVNEKREALGLSFLDADGLPIANRDPRASMNDDEIEAEFRRRDTSNALSILLNASEKTRTAIGRQNDEREKEARRRKREELAASLGMTIEELNAHEREQVTEASRT